MTEKQIVKECLKQQGWSQETLANMAGYNTQSAIGNRLSGKKSMRVDILVKLLSCMGYEVVIRSTSTNKNKSQWVISYEEEEK